MKAAVLSKAQKIILDERPEPVVGPEDVLIRVRAVGVCGSDVHYYHHGGIGVHAVTRPIILGHECAGEVVGVGHAVRRLKIGDRVVAEPAVPCGQCQQCREGRYNLCPNVRCMGTPPVDGCFCEYIAWPQDFTYAIPANLSFEAAALVEPLVVGVYAVEQAGLRPQTSVAILGAASVGLLTLAVAKKAGAGRTFVIDRVPERLEFAKKLGADEAIDFSRQDPVKVIQEATGGKGVQVVFEAAGSPAAVAQTTQLVGAGGTIVLIGICPEDTIPFNFGAARRKEVTIKFVRRYRHVFPRAIELATSGALDLSSLVSHQFSLEQTADALEAVRQCKPGMIKAVIRP